MLKPVGNRVIVLEKSEPKEEKTKSGLIIPKSNNQQQVKEGLVITSNVDSINSNDMILFHPMSGAYITHDGKQYKILNAEEILAVIEETEGEVENG